MNKTQRFFCAWIALAENLLTIITLGRVETGRHIDYRINCLLRRCRKNRRFR
jgi:hypothetical protein